MGTLKMVNENSNKKIKVCHVTSAHHRYDVRIFHKECKSLVNKGFDVTLLVNDNIPDEFIEGVSIISTQFKPKNRFARMVKSKKLIRKNMLEIDAEIYHFHDPELLTEAAWIKNKGKKVIFDFHEDVSQQILYKEWIPQNLRKIISSIYKKYEENIIINFHALISVTPKFVERLKKINTNTVMITNYPIIKENVKRIETIKKKAICFAGGITSQWNHENIIKAIEPIEDIEYILAGSGPLDYLEELKKLEGWKKVRYLGRIPHERVNEIYSESMIGMALLSNDTQVGDEGTLGNTKIFEYMQAGIAIICSNNRIWNEIITKHEIGKAIHPTDIEEIKRAIDYFMSDTDIAIDKGKKGHIVVEREFNWKTQEEILFDLYYRLISRR